MCGIIIVIIIIRLGYESKEGWYEKTPSPPLPMHVAFFYKTTWFKSLIGERTRF